MSLHTLRLNDEISVIHSASNWAHFSNVVCYFDNSRMGKAKFTHNINKIISHITSIRISRLIGNICPSFYIMTDYPKLYVRKIGDDILADCNKIMFNKAHTTILNNTYEQIDELIHAIDGITPNNTIIIRMHSHKCTPISHTYSEYNVQWYACDLVYGTNLHNQNIITLGKYEAIPAIYIKLVKNNISDELCIALSKYIDNVQTDNMNKNTINLIKSLLDKKLTLIKIKQRVNNLDSNGLYKDLMKKIIRFDSTMDNIVYKFKADNAEIIKLEADLSKSFDTVSDKVYELIKHDDISTVINGSDGIFKSFITMMNWIEELESKSCIGLAVSAYTTCALNKVYFNITSIPNICVSILDFMELISGDTNNYNISINDICIADNPYNNDKINIVVPLYINKTHWEISKNYLNIVSNIIMYGYPFTKDMYYYRLYFSMLTDYISALFVNTKNDLSDNSVILFFAYWKTTIEIGNLLNINCEKIFIDNKDTNYKYFDYSSLIGQLLSTTLTENTQKYFVRTIENMIKSCVYNADCNIADYLTYITYLIEFFEFICKNNVVISELTSMESNNSVISCECINLVKNIINNNNKAKYAPQKIINNYIKKTIPDYDINKIISVMDNNWLVKDTFGENPHVNEPSINNELSQQIENV